MFENTLNTFINYKEIHLTSLNEVNLYMEK